MKDHPVLVIAGPTASGKTAVSVEVAKQLGGEIISADSMQIYDTIQIGTARPTLEEMQGIPHHLLGFLPLSESYSVAQYADDARAIILDLESRHKLPIFCGGTGLYLQAVLENIQYTKAETDFALRQTLLDEAARLGGEQMLEKLRKFDPETASILHPNDITRIVRAIEVYETSGQTISEQKKESKSVPSPYNALYLVLDFHNRETLYHRIHTRVDRMMENGLLDETKRVLGLPDGKTALQAIGYKELFPYLQGEISLEEAVENLKKSTRHYAKRQLSWFHHVEGAQSLYVDDYRSVSDLAHEIVNRFNDYLNERGENNE